MILGKEQLIAVVSILATAVTALYSTYSQTQLNILQQQQSIDIERYKISQELSLVETEVRAELFQNHCNKVESAIQKVTSLLIEDGKDSGNSEYKFMAINYIYLLPASTKNTVIKMTDEYNTEIISTIYSALHIEYEQCIGKL